MRRSVVTIPFLVLLAAPVSAQVAFDAPSLIGPASPNGLAIYLTNSDPGDGLAGSSLGEGRVGEWTRGAARPLGRGVDGDLALGGGIDISGVLSRGLEDSDIDIL
ncbi:MAG TPA: hypothetical protein EYM78_02530 [Gemmatimonadetes bacterium]|mgnify:FL=1|nr:hypothetical protein [Gemmatimonadota bacterium]HAC06059.1 hypothetical protein [Gemmatimonadota bacterium]HIC54901.1 hypothetical protein [Gemmatimonadota bacterium]HIN49575.1 hypothetical protein [Gemmatimonadota bacterium]